jgi:subtilisin family serine protease
VTATRVVRRFAIRVTGAEALPRVERAVMAAVEAQPPGEVTPLVIDHVQRPPLLEVRLEGVAAVVSDVMARIATIQGVRIHHDVLRARRDGMRTRRDGNGSAVYPDLSARVRIGAESLPPTTDGVPVTVAIVDSGLMVEHPAFTDHLWTGGGGVHGKQFIDGKSHGDISDQDGHGTLQAGTVLASAVDAPVKLMTAKFFDAANPARPDNAAAALDFAVREGAQIILLAWDVGIGSVVLERVFRNACAQALVVIAAGNYGSDNDWYDGRSLARAPVRYARDCPEATIVVMATDEADEKAWFSNYGRVSVDLAAPGSGIMSTRRSLSKSMGSGAKAYRTHGGTSAAAAHVAGAAALLMSRYPSLTVSQIKGCLVDSVDKLPALLGRAPGGSKCASGGRLNIGAALRRAAEEAKKNP